MEAYSTATVHRQERIEYWQDICSRAYADLKLAARDHHNFEGKLHRVAAGPLSFVKVSSSAACITRAEGAGTANSRYEIFLTLEGESLCRHNGERALLRPGDFTLVDLALPYSFEFEQQCSAVSMGLPKSLLAAYLPRLSDYLGRSMSGAPGLNRLAAVTISCLCEQMQSGALTELGPSLVRGLLDVITAAYLAVDVAPTSHSAVAAARRVRIRAFIEANLRDPQLSPGYIAAALAISPRYLRLLFSEHDESISRYVIRRRLDEAVRELSGVSCRGITITDIAYRWGFSDAAHFARLFRDRFGMSPRRYREIHAERR